MSKAQQIIERLESPLYHTTTMRGLRGILKSKELSPTPAPIHYGDPAGGYNKSVSFSRQPSAWWNKGGERDAKMVFRGDKLQHTSPYALYPNSREGSEQRTQKAVPVDKHLAGIEVKDPGSRWGRFKTTLDVRRHTDVPMAFVKDTEKMTKDRYLFHKSLRDDSSPGRASSLLARARGEDTAPQEKAISKSIERHDRRQDRIAGEWKSPSSTAKVVTAPVTIKKP